MSSGAEQVSSHNGGDGDGNNADHLTDTSGSSHDRVQQDDLDVSLSNTQSDLVDTLEDQKSSSEVSQQPSVNEGSPQPAPAAPGSFSMAQALSMIRQRREQEQRVAEAQEEEKQAQKLEKVRERRRRQRRNQRARKAQLKIKGNNVGEEPESSPDHQRELPPEVPSTSNLHGSSQTKAAQSEPNTSTELKRSHESAVEDGDAMLKRLPVKKRIKLESAIHLLAQASPVDGSRNNSDNVSKPESIAMVESASSRALKAGADGGASANGNSGLSQINRFIPRALVLKMGKAMNKKA